MQIDLFFGIILHVPPSIAVKAALARHASYHQAVACLFLDFSKFSNN